MNVAFWLSWGGRVRVTSGSICDGSFTSHGPKFNPSNMTGGSSSFL